MPVVTRHGLTFVCDDPFELARAESVETKEPGTIQWLRDHVRAGDVVYDIGANIGVYTLVASTLVGPTGHVYAFEPHVANAAALLRNVRRNGWTDRVTVLTVALAAQVGFAPFHYRSLRPGSSGHQHATVTDGTGQTFDPAITECKAITTVDALWSARVVRAPDLVKMDVDGGELGILWGMPAVLERPTLRSLQIETAPGTRQAMTSYLARLGFQVVGRHFTAQGQALFAQGVPADAITDNTVYARST